MLVAILVPFALGVGSASAATGAIAGTVSSADGPLAGACVNVFMPGAGEQGSALTDPSGHYSIEGLATGSYKVLFQGCDNFEYVEEWYEDAADEASATPVAVSDGGVTTVNATLDNGGSVSGRITDEEGTPLAAECVSVGNDTRGWGVNTDADGMYRIPGLPAGSYKAFFGCAAPGNYLSEWYDDKPNPWTADPIAVTLGVETSGIDAALTPAGHITGTVTDESGAPIYGVCVEAHGSSDFWQVATDEFGGYVIDQLPSDDYRLSFRDCVQVTHLPEWYDDKPDMSSADPVTVVGGQTRSGIDAVLSNVSPATGHILGHVTDLDGAPLAGICVEVRTAVGVVQGTWTTNEDGDYETTSFVPNDYRVLFRDCAPGGGTTAEWYNDKPTFTQADPVHVPAGGNARADANLQTCATGPDSDGDGLTDCEESGSGSDPRDTDSDGDLFGDRLEREGGTCLIIPLEGGSDPNNIFSNPLLELPLPPTRLPTPIDPVCP